MEGFKRPSEVDPTIVDSKSDNKFTQFPRLYEADFLGNMVEEEESKEYWAVVYRPNQSLSKNTVKNKFDYLDRAVTWDMVDNIERG
jgi:hypothetical protein